MFKVWQTFCSYRKQSIKSSKAVVPPVPTIDAKTIIILIAQVTSQDISTSTQALQQVCWYTVAPLP